MTPRTVRRYPYLTVCTCGRVLLGQSRRGGRGWKKYMWHAAMEHGGHG